MNERSIVLTGMDNEPLEIRVYDNGNAPVGLVFILPDYNGHIAFSETYRQSLVDAGYHICILNTRGYNQERIKNLKDDMLSLMIEDLEVIMADMRAQFIEIPFILMGFGLGGHVALFYQLKRKVKEIACFILFAPWMSIKARKVHLFKKEWYVNDEPVSGTVSKTLLNAVQRSMNYVKKEMVELKVDHYVYTNTSHDQSPQLNQFHFDKIDEVEKETLHYLQRLSQSL